MLFDWSIYVSDYGERGYKYSATSLIHCGVQKAVPNFRSIYMTAASKVVRPTMKSIRDLTRYDTPISSIRLCTSIKMWGNWYKRKLQYLAQFRQYAFLRFLPTEPKGSTLLWTLKTFSKTYHLNPWHSKPRTRSCQSLVRYNLSLCLIVLPTGAPWVAHLDCHMLSPRTCRIDFGPQFRGSIRGTSLFISIIRTENLRHGYSRFQYR
jgi:hypothetical protein